MDKLVRLGKAAELMGVTRITAHNWEKRGLLSATKIGGERFFRADQLPHVIPINKTRKMLQYPEGFNEPEILETARKLGYTFG